MESWFGWRGILGFLSVFIILGLWFGLGFLYALGSDTAVPLPKFVLFFIYMPLLLVKPFANFGVTTFGLRLGLSGWKSSIFGLALASLHVFLGLKLIWKLKQKNEALRKE